MRESKTEKKRKKLFFNKIIVPAFACPNLDGAVRRSHQEQKWWLGRYTEIASAAIGEITKIKRDI